MKKILYVSLLATLVFITFGKALQFTFWKDDWLYIWNDLYVSHFLTPILLHPGTYTEIHLFSRLSGIHPFFWQLSGLILKILASISVSLMAREVTRSKKTAALSGIFFAISSSGLESTIWVSAHVLNILVILLSLSVYYQCRYLRNGARSNLLISVILLTGAIIDDPLRALPRLIIFIFLLRNRVTSWKPVIAATGVIALSVGILMKSTIYSSPIFRYIKTNNHGIAGILSRVHVIGQYFNSLFNLMTNFIIPPSHYINEASHGLYNPLFARLGLVIVMLAFLLIVFLWRSNKTIGERIFVLFLWMLVFYIPNWLSEPRIIATGNHRYLTVSNVGFIILISYALSFVKSRYIAAFLAAVFIVANVAAAHRELSGLSAYRSASVVNSVWNQIDMQVSTLPGQKLFMFTGEEPADTNIFVISQAVPFALKRKITEQKFIPFVTNDPAVAAQRLCKSDSLTVNDIYAWEIHNDGSLKNLTGADRIAVQNVIQATGTDPQACPRRF